MEGTGAISMVESGGRDVARRANNAVEFSFPKDEDHAVGHGGCNRFGEIMNTMSERFHRSD